MYILHAVEGRKEFNREHIILEALGGKGEKYLKDYIAVDIRNFLTKYDYKKNYSYPLN